MHIFADEAIIKKQFLRSSMKIDAVITWVDGNDPVHRGKRMRYADPGMIKDEAVAGETRFAAVGEIAWCVASLNRFAPWINRIFIVTDAQDPDLGPFLERNFPQGHIPVEIVDHKVIYNGYEEYLPTFNASAIETMIWRIPGLSDRFISLNDDMMLSAPVMPSDFFTEDDRSVCYTEWENIPLTLFTRMLKSRRGGRRRVTFKGVLCNGAILGGDRWSYMRINHTPRALRRDFYEEYYTSHPQDMIRNIQYRFRNHDMYVPEVLQYTLLRKQGRCVTRPVKDNLFYLEPNGRKGYIGRKLKLLDKGNHRFCCFNSIDKASEEDMRLVLDRITKILNITL